MTFALFLIAVIAIALIARAASRGRAASSDPRAWLAGQDVSPPPPAPPPPVEELAGRAIAPPSSEDIDEETGEGEAMAYAQATTSDGWGFIPDRDGVAVSRTDHLDPGQFVAAQVRRQEADSGYWLLEVLGREEIEIVRPPPDENGEPRVFTAEDVEKSRRLFEEPLPDSEPARDG
jgi:hypothetical protein